MTRARKNVGRIQFVGCGPADASLITGRAYDAIHGADEVIVDTDVPEDVRAFATGEIVETDEDARVRCADEALDRLLQLAGRDLARAPAAGGELRQSNRLHALTLRTRAKRRRGQVTPDALRCT